MLSAPASATSPSSTFADFTGRQLRVARLRAAIIANEITAMEIGLQAGLVSPEAAVAHLIQIGAAGLLRWRSSHE